MLWWVVGELARVRLTGFTTRENRVEGRTLFVDVSSRDVPLTIEGALALDGVTYRLRTDALSAPTARYLTNLGDLPGDDEGARRALGALLTTPGVNGVDVQPEGTAVELHPRARPTTATVERTIAFVRAAQAVLGRADEGRLACPTCAPVVLDQGRGAFAEPVCPSCHGHFLGADLARELVYEPRAITPGDLADATGDGAARCPRCARPMSPVLLDEDIVDVCRACGALWLDAGELSRVTHGRVDG